MQIFTLRADMRTLHAELRGEISTLRIETNARFDRLESKLDSVLTLLAHIAGRVTHRVTHLEERQ